MLFLAGLFLAGGGFGIYRLLFFKKCFAYHELVEQRGKSVGYIHHEYKYIIYRGANNPDSVGEIQQLKNSHFLIKLDNTSYEFDPNPENISLKVVDSRMKGENIGIQGSGFFVSEEGHVVTNLHVAYPWSLDEFAEVKYFTNLVRIFVKIREQEIRKKNQERSLNTDREIESDAYSSAYNYSAEPITTLWGIIPNNQQFSISAHSLKQFQSSPAFSRNTREDFCVFKLKEERLPVGCSYIKESDIGDSVEDLKVGQELFLLGYPGGRKTAENNNDAGLMQATPSMGEIKILNYNTDKYKMTYGIKTSGGASGSPVFDVCTGKLVAIHFAGESIKDIENNYGIYASRLKKLLVKEQVIEDK